MATFFKNTVINDIGTTPVRVLETDTNSRMTVIGLSLTNLIETSILASITVTDDTSTAGYYLKNVEIPPRTSLRAVNGGEKLIIAPNNSLEISSDTPDSIDAVISFVEII